MNIKEMNISTEELREIAEKDGIAIRSKLKTGKEETQVSKELKETMRRVTKEDINEAIDSVYDADFEERVKHGHRGEDLLKAYLEATNMDYTDCTRRGGLEWHLIKHFEKIDVDFVIENILTDEEMKVEVKTPLKGIFGTKRNGEEYTKDIHIKVGTMYSFEELSKRLGNDSWLYRTHADYMFFICLNENKILSIKTCDLISYIEENAEKLNWTRFRDNKNKKYECYNKGVYIKTEELIDAGKTKTIHMNKFLKR